MIKIGLIGAGMMGSMHAACYEALTGSANFKVTAVADANLEQAEKLAAKFGAEAFPSGAELIEEGDINTVDICLPTYLHKDAALAAMLKGYHVFIEKPVCMNKAEAQELLAMQLKMGPQVMIGQCIRFWPEYMELKAYIDDNRYGKLISGVFTRISPRPDWAWNNWLGDASKGGLAALDLHIHDVDYVRYILGLPQYIKSEISQSQNHIFSLYKYEGAIISIEGSWDYPTNFPFEMAFRVKFEQATVTYSSRQSPTMQVYEENGLIKEPNLADELSESEGASLTIGNITSLGGYYNELNYFLQSLQNGLPIANATLEDGCASLELTLEAMGASQTR